MGKGKTSATDTRTLAWRAYKAISVIPEGAPEDTVGGETPSGTAAVNDGRPIVRISSVRNFDPCSKWHGEGTGRFPQRCAMRWDSLRRHLAARGLTLKIIRYTDDIDDADATVYATREPKS